MAAFSRLVVFLRRQCVFQWRAPQQRCQPHEYCCSPRFLAGFIGNLTSSNLKSKEGKVGRRGKKSSEIRRKGDQAAEKASNHKEPYKAMRQDGKGNRAGKRRGAYPAGSPAAKPRPRELQKPIAEQTKKRARRGEPIGGAGGNFPRHIDFIHFQRF